jgi:hypothetical protein
MQGAVPALAYDGWAPVRTLAQGLDDQTPDRYGSYYGNGIPYFYGVMGAGTYINYFNTNDWLLTAKWRQEQDAKPDSGHRWDGTSFWRRTSVLADTLLLFPLDRYEIFACCDEARCEALGAQANVGGQFWTGVKFNQVDLSAFPHNFGNADKDHSAQFLSDCADRWEFWYGVLNSMGFKP